MIVDAYYYAADLDSSKRGEALSCSAMSNSSDRSIFGSFNSSHASSTSSSSASSSPASSSSKIIFTSGSSNSSSPSSQNTVIRGGHRRDSNVSSSSSCFSSSRHRHNLSSSSSISLNSITNISNLDDNDSDVGNDEDNNNESAQSAVLVREVGHNLYILAHKLARFNKELSALLRSNINSSNNSTTTIAFNYYASRTAQIEVFRLFFIFKFK